MEVKPALFSKSLPAGACIRTDSSKTVMAQVWGNHSTNSDTDQSSPFLLGSRAGRFFHGMLGDPCQIIVLSMRDFFYYYLSV